ncbi:MAG: FlgD immunoglobulin-like domain containing protein [bacterium]|nr:FlgD immunoglobulin-like domain containing protein [bacterium]
METPSPICYHLNNTLISCEFGCLQGGVMKVACIAWVFVALITLNAATGGAEIWGVKSHDPVSGPPSTLFHFPEDGGQLTIVGVVNRAGTAIDVDGLTVNAAQQLFGFEIAGGAAGSRLLSISMADASATIIGPFLEGRDIRGAAITAGGLCLALDATADDLLTIDLQTGLAVGPGTALLLDGEPYDVTDLCDLTETGSGDLVFAYWNELYRLDAATGELTLLNRDMVPGPDGIDVGAAGLAWAPASAGGERLFVYDVQVDDDIYGYDPAGGYARQDVHINIIATYNAGRGDLASAPSFVVGAGNAQPAAADLRLLGNHPNPFNPRTTVVFSLREAGPVRLTVYDLAGSSVRELAAGWYAAGRHEVVWEGRDDLGRVLPAGIYSCCARSAGRSAWTRMTLVK